MRENVHTWARLARLDLYNLSISLGNASLEELPKWPANGDGRAVKATTEKITRTLDRTFDRRDLNFSFDVIDKAILLFNEIADNAFFKQHLSHKPYIDRKNRSSTYGAAIVQGLPPLQSYIVQNRPSKADFLQGHARPQKHIAASEDDKLGDLVPPQRSAPIQFAVLNGKLQVKRQSARPLPEDRHLLEAGKSALQNDATSLIQSLEETNADPRLSLALSEMRDILSSDADIIRLGMMSTTCESLIQKFADQIPEVAGAKLEAFGANLAMFVSHFPDWQKFVSHATASEKLESSDIEIIFRSSTELISHLQVDDKLVDPQVPLSLKLLLESIRDADRSSKRAVYAVVRTLENLIGVIFLGFGGLFGAGFAGMKEGLKTSAKIATIAVLLGAAAHTATNLSPSAARIIQSDWMEKASAIVRKALNPD